MSTIVCRRAGETAWGCDGEVSAEQVGSRAGTTVSAPRMDRTPGFGSALRAAPVVASPLPRLFGASSNRPWWRDLLRRRMLAVADIGAAAVATAFLASQ